MKVAGAEPIVARGLEGLRSYRLRRASGRFACHESDLGSARGGSERSIQAGGRGPVAVEGALMLPSGPGDARQFVGEGDGRLVVAAAPLGGDRPGPQSIE